MTKPSIIIATTLIGSSVYLLIAFALFSDGMDGRFLLAGAMLTATGITYAGWFLNMRSSNQRVQKLIENLALIRAGKEPQQPEQGKDLVCQLDQALFGIGALIADHRKSLESSDQKTRILVETVPVGIIISTSSGIILTTNPRTQQLLEKEPQDLSGKSLNEIFPDLQIVTPFDADPPKGKLEASVQLAERQIFLELTVREFGKTGTWLASVSDITERKEIERMKQEFMQMITHDLRAPLTSILIYLELLTTGHYGELSGAALKRARATEDSCQRLVDLVNSLLDIEKYATGTIELDYELSEVASIFERSVHSLAGIIEERDLEVEIFGAELELECDEERLTQVVINLLSNGVKYSPDGGCLTISAVAVGDMIKFSVADQGPGIPLEYRASVFDRFYQVPGKAKKGSSGLGLAICNEIVKAHHGQIGVDSNDNGVGSNFWFTIPRNQVKT